MELLFKHRNLPEQVADHIVILLATDKLKAGQRLFEKELCAMLGVSRIPVREALRILQAQGVVRTEPNRGTFISELNSEETSELLKIRLSVEKLAARRLALRAKDDPSILDPLQEALEEVKRRDKFGDKLASCQADLAFHSLMVELSGSNLLLPTWESLARGVLVFFMHERQAYYDYDTFVDDHERLMEAIRVGKLTMLDAVMEEHILESNPSKAKRT